MEVQIFKINYLQIPDAYLSLKNACILKQLISHMLQFFAVRERLLSDWKIEIFPILLQRNITAQCVWVTAFFTSV
jgi:hypothetical protein